MSPSTWQVHWYVMYLMYLACNGFDLCIYAFDGLRNTRGKGCAISDWEEVSKPFRYTELLGQHAHLQDTEDKGCEPEISVDVLGCCSRVCGSWGWTWDLYGSLILQIACQPRTRRSDVPPELCTLRKTTSVGGRRDRAGSKFGCGSVFQAILVFVPPYLNIGGTNKISGIYYRE